MGESLEVINGRRVGGRSSALTLQKLQRLFTSEAEGQPSADRVDEKVSQEEILVQFLPSHIPPAGRQRREHSERDRTIATIDIQ